MNITELTDSVTGSVRIVDRLAGGVEALALAVVTRAAGWIASIPTLLLTSRTCEVIFDLAPGAALASAVALEVVGQSVVNTWLRAKGWNRNKRQTDRPASEWLMLAAMVGYFATDFTLVGILVMPKALGAPVYWAALLFPLAQVISTVVTGERAAQFRREADAEADSVKRSAVASAARRKAKKEVEAKEQVLKQEFAYDNHANRRAPASAAYEVMARDGWRCYYCGVDMSDWPRDEIHVDHFYPVVAGGSDNPYNLVVSCKSCNLTKHARIPTADEVHRLKVHLVRTLDIPAKEKVWLLQSVDGVMKQKDIASALEISPSYVSASVKEQPDELSERLTTLCAELGVVGEPVSILTESESELIGDEVYQAQKAKVLQ